MHRTSCDLTSGIPFWRTEDRRPLVSSGVLGYTGRLGGMIRHPEFHGGAQTTGNETNEARDDDDEGEAGGKGRVRNRGRR